MTSGAPLKRAFVAVEPPAPVLDAVQRLVDDVATTQRDLRWTTREQWHVTLAFLGAVPDVGVLADALARGVEPGARSIVGLGGGGAFPRVERGSVLWLGMREGGAAVAELAELVARAVATVGFAAAEGPYTPHLTLARARRPRDLRALAAAIGDCPVGPTWELADVVLYESDTRPEGARHTARARFAL